MKTLYLDGAQWRTKDDFYDAFFEAVGAPDWHGRNLDALNDSVGTGGINKIELPYHIKIGGLATMQPDARNMVQRFADLISHLQCEGCEVALEFSE